MRVLKGVRVEVLTFPSVGQREYPQHGLHRGVPSALIRFARRA